MARKRKTHFTDLKEVEAWLRSQLTKLKRLKRKVNKKEKEDERKISQ